MTKIRPLIFIGKSDFGILHAKPYWI